jgi:hypothetical protein
VDEEKLQKGAEIENMLHQPTSARMRARMKKEAKRAMQKEGDGAKLRSSQSSLNNSDANIKTRSVVTDQPQNKDKIVIESVFDADRAFEDANEWPFERFCDELLIEMVKYVSNATRTRKLKLTLLAPKCELGHSTRSCSWTT